MLKMISFFLLLETLPITIDSRSHHIDYFYPFSIPFPCHSNSSTFSTNFTPIICCKSWCWFFLNDLF